MGVLEGVFQVCEAVVETCGVVEDAEHGFLRKGEERGTLNECSSELWKELEQVRVVDF